VKKLLCGFAQMMKVGVQKVKVWTPKDEIEKVFRNNAIPQLDAGSNGCEFCPRNLKTQQQSFRLQFPAFCVFN
jgi:hypothetical protein